MKVATVNDAIFKKLDDLEKQLEEKKSAYKGVAPDAQLPEKPANFDSELKQYWNHMEEIQEEIDNLKMYRKLDCKDDPNTLHANGYHDWLRIDKFPRRFSVKDRASYQAFVEGWLMYFEQHSSTNIKEDRTLFFDWGNAKDKYGLVIYLKPLYSRNYTDYKYNTKEVKQARKTETAGWLATAVFKEARCPHHLLPQTRIHRQNRRLLPGEMKIYNLPVL